MSRIEPEWGAANTDFSGSFASEPIDQHFEIALGSRLRKNAGQVLARSFESKGTLSFAGDRVTIRTSVSRLLGADILTNLELRRTDIYNVRMNGRIVQFDLVNGPGELEPIVLRARDKSAAAAIVSFMPDRMTPRYATENQQRLHFLEQITTRTPHVWVTWTLIVMTSLVYIAMAVRGTGLVTIDPASAVVYGSNFGPYTLKGQWWRLMTSVFIHFGLGHIVLNMVVLAQVGRTVERLFGNARFLALYLFAGLTGSLMSLLWHPGTNSAGASGAIFGVLGALLAYVIRYSESIPRSIYLKNLHIAAAFILYNLIYGFTHHGIDNGAHVGGLLGGFILACVLAPPVEDPASPGAPGALRERSAMPIVSSSVLGVLVLGALLWALHTLSVRPDRQQEMHFAQVLYDVNPLTQHAAADLKALGLEPAMPEARAQYGQRIRTQILPEWNQLYSAVDNAQVPSGSADAVLKDRLLRYYSDLSQALQVTANMDEHPELRGSDTQAEIKSLLNDAKRQLAAIKTGTGPL
jgi:rhomboid protease GluP